MRQDVRRNAEGGGMCPFWLIARPAALFPLSLCVFHPCREPHDLGALWLHAPPRVSAAWREKSAGDTSPLGGVRATILQFLEGAKRGGDFSRSHLSLAQEVETGGT